MKTLFILVSVMVILFIAAPNKVEAQKRKAKVTNVKIPKELILQMAKDDDQVKSSLQEQGGNTVKFAAENFSADLLDLNRDGKPEWFIGGIGSWFCGNRVCSQWIYREVADKYELLLEGGGVPLTTYTNSYRDLESHNGLESGYNPYIPTIFTYDGKKYREGYDFTLNQIITPSKLNEIKKLVSNDSKKRLVRVKNNYLKDDEGNSWYEEYEDTFQEKMKKEYWAIQLEKTFKVSNKGISFYYDATFGFAMSMLASEPDNEYFYSWAVLKPYLMPSSPISSLVK